MKHPYNLKGKHIVDLFARSSLFLVKIANKFLLEFLKELFQLAFIFLVLK
jgi:hypothetical protein